MATRANKVEVEIVASDEASPKIDKLTQKIDGLEADEARVTVTANTERLEKQLDAARKKLHTLDGDEASVQARLVGTLESDLIEARRLFEQLDGQTGTVTLKANTADLEAGLDKSKKSLGDMGDLAGKLPGPLGEAAGLLAGGGGIAGGAALAAGSLLAMAQNAANVALEAQTIADLTGATVEDSSRWLALTKRAGIEYNDLADIVGQVGQVLRQQPEMAKQLGINLNDGRDGLERIVQVLEQVNATTSDANERAYVLGQLFGEQGVRQVQLLASAVGGDLQKALDTVSDTQIISEADVRRAREFQQMWARAVGYAQGLALTIGQDVIPVLTTATDLVDAMNGGLSALSAGHISLGDIIGPTSWLTPQGQVIKGIGLIRDALSDTEKQADSMFDTVSSGIGKVVEESIAHGKAMDQQALSAAAANEQMEAYVGWLEETGEQVDTQQRLVDASEQQRNALARLNTEAERVDRARIAEREQNAVANLRDEYKRLREDLSDRRSLLQLQGQFDDLRDKAEAAFTAAATGAENAEDAERDYQIAQLDTIDNALAYVSTLKQLPSKVVTDIEALIDQGAYNEAANALEILSKPRSVFLQASLDEQALAAQLRRFYANNGINPAFGPRSLPPSGGGGPTATPFQVTVNMPVGSRGVDVLRQVTGQARRSGRRYGVPVVSYARR